MTPEETRAYNRGYNAGRKRLRSNITIERQARERSAFWNRAFLAALPTCMELQGWTKGTEPIRTVEQRTHLASSFANEAMQYRK